MTKEAKQKRKRTCLGVFAGAHGVKGHAKVKTYTENPESITAYGPLETEDGKRQFTFTILGFPKPGLLLVTAPEIKSREDAVALSGVTLFVDRHRLPPTEDDDEFYLDDLVGLRAVDENGGPIGHVHGVYNFGAGDLLELADIPDVKGLRLIPFTKVNIPIIDLTAGMITVRREAIDLGEDENETKSESPDGEPHEPGRNAE